MLAGTLARQGEYPRPCQIVCQRCRRYNKRSRNIRRNGGDIVPAKTLMLQGTASSVGKSLLVAGLCRLYARRGIRVAPFKAQNMSNNAGVTFDGGEIGRAQFTQAEACGLAPRVEMNPILLKPEADNRSQVVVLGKPWNILPADAYYHHRDALWTIVTTALDRLRADVELVIIEGAGSPVELNLKAGDLVNMPIARYADSPVLLVGDIDVGGVFAQMLGTLWLLEPEERALVRGLIVNKFRGDLALFADGVRILEERGQAPVLGVVPWLHDHGVAEEDAVVLERGQWASAGEGSDIAVVAFPRIANFDDLDPLRAEQGVQLRLVRSARALGRPDAIILPGTKYTLADLAWLRQTGLAAEIRALADHGTAVVGICGGYQMLGQSLADPDGVEAGGTAEGLRLLPTTVTFRRKKETWQVQAQHCGTLPWLEPAATLTGYEIHAGEVETPSPLLLLQRANGEFAYDGAATANGQVWGTHLHGLFHNAVLRRSWLRSIGWQPVTAENAAASGDPMAAYDRLADALEAALDIPQLDAIINLPA